MELDLQSLSKWDTDKKGNIVLSAPMSPMLAAQDFIKKVFEQEKMILTGLFRLSGKDETTFTTWEHADIYPVQCDAIVGILNFRHIISFTEVGSRYIPICMILDGEPQFNEAFLKYKWLSVPSKEDIVGALNTLDLPGFKEQFEKFRWTVLLEKADEWFWGLSPERMLEISETSTPIESSLWWNKLTNEDRYRTYKKHESESNHS